MRSSACVALAVALCLPLSAPLAAQQNAPAKTPKPTNKTLVLEGCVAPDPTKKGAFTLSESEEDTLYRLTGTDMREYSGQVVRVAGILPRRVRIVGGLYPSANVAAQAGTIDPTKAAIAAADPGTSGRMTYSEFRVRSVQVIPGACPK